MEPTTLRILPNCPVCGAGDPRPHSVLLDHSFSRSSFRVQECGACGFCFTNPRPEETVISWYYGSKDYISHTNAAKTILERVYQAARWFTIRSKYRLIHHLHPRGSVLDFGCGTGDLIGFLQHKAYSVHGVEPGDSARAKALELVGSKVVPDLASLPKGLHFDAIMLWHVLEHVPDLHKTLTALVDRLASGGSLIIAVPTRDSWDAAYYGEFWAAWDVPRHLSHFRKADVIRLLQGHGFDNVASKRMWLDSFYISLLSEQYRGSSRIISFAKAVLIGSWSDIRALFSGRPTSSTLFVARKP